MVEYENMFSNKFKTILKLVLIFFASVIIVFGVVYIYVINHMPHYFIDYTVPKVCNTDNDCQNGEVCRGPTLIMPNQPIRKVCVTNCEKHGYSTCPKGCIPICGSDCLNCADCGSCEFSE